MYQVFLEQQWFLKNRTIFLSNRGSISYFDLVVLFSITQIHSSIGKNFVTLFPTRTSVFWKKNFIANSFLKSSSHKTLFIETYSRTVPLTYDHGFHPTSGSKFQIQYSRKNYCQKFFIFITRSPSQIWVKKLPPKVWIFEYFFADFRKKPRISVEISRNLNIFNTYSRFFEIREKKYLEKKPQISKSANKKTSNKEDWV